MRRGGSSSAANGGAGGGGGLAITERQKPAPSRVAALFQMLAKRKLFSSSSSKKTKLLAPVREQRFSPGRPPGGGVAVAGENTPVAKKRPLLLDSADYARSKSESNGTNRLPPPTQDSNSSEMCTPGVVARLMGLSSMPAISHERSARATDSSESEVDGHRNESSQGLPGSSGSMGAFHQRQQKPGQVMDEWHDNAGKFIADSQALLSGRHHNHKVSSPLRSPRSISSRNKARLMEAAARVLEPGLQSKNRHRAQRQACLEYPCNGDGVATAAAAVARNLPGQLPREMRDVDASMAGTGDAGATSQHNSAPRQWSEENCKKIAADRRPNQNVAWQGQPGGNIKVLPASSSSEKARFKESDEMIFNAATADTYQDARKNQPRNVSRGNVASSPLKQNNLKQNALPTVSRTEDQQHMVQRQKHRTGEQYVASTGKDFVSLNKSMNSSTSLRSKGKVMDEIRAPRSGTQNKSLSTKGHRTNGLRSDNSNKPKLRDASPKAMDKDMIIAKGAGLVSEKPKNSSPNYVRNDLLRSVEPHNASRCNDSDIVSFTFSSPMKAIPTCLLSKNTSAVMGSPNGTCLKRDSPRDCHNISSDKELAFRKKSQGTSSMEAAESVCFNRDELKKRDIPGGRVISSKSEKAGDFPVLQKTSSDELLRELDSLMYVFGELPNSVDLRETHKKHEANVKASKPSRSAPGGNRQRGTLRPTYADENCTAGSPNYTEEAQFEDKRLSETSAPPSNLRDATTERNARRAEPNSGQHGADRSAPAVQCSKPEHPAGEVTVTSAVDLLLTNVCSSGLHHSKEAFLLRTSESVLAALTTTSSNSNSSNNRPKASGANPLRGLALDLVTACLDSMCAELCDSGYVPFARLAATVRTEGRLATEVRKDVMRRGAAAGQALDDLAAGDVERAAAEGVAREAFRIGALIERDLVQELVRELGTDMLRAAVNL